MAGNKNSGRIGGSQDKAKVRRAQIRYQVAKLRKDGLRDWIKEKLVMEDLLAKCEVSLSHDDGKKISADNAYKWARAMEGIIRTLKMLYGEIIPDNPDGVRVPQNMHSVIVQFINSIGGNKTVEVEGAQVATESDKP